MASLSILYAIDFNNYLAGKQFDAVIIRGDRFEMLGLTMVASYKGIPIVHLEGGDVSGVIDNRVRHAITHLSDYHFCTNENSHRRLVQMGAPLDHVWNFGSLDVEYAAKVKPKKLRDKPYILVAFHPITGEDEGELDAALAQFLPSIHRPRDYGFDIIKIGSNADYGRGYGTEQYSPEDYINLMRFSKVCVGNSSSLLKEASILGVPVVNIGSRQNARLKPKNVFDVACKERLIASAIKYQLEQKYRKDRVYYQKDTSKKIVNKLKAIL